MKVNKNKVNTEEVKEVIAKEVSQDNKATKKMNKALALVFDVFGLEDRGYVMTAFKDKGNRCSIELANEDFTVDVDIKNCERFGLIENEE
jgi:hypothetical protein